MSYAKEKFCSNSNTEILKIKSPKSKRELPKIDASSPSIVYINGEYWGIHNMREKLDKHFIKTHFSLKENEFDILEVCGTPNHGNVSQFKSLMDFIRDNDIKDSTVYQYVIENIDIDNYIDQHLAEIYNSTTKKMEY